MMSNKPEITADAENPRPVFLLRMGAGLMNGLEWIHQALLPLTRRLFGSTAADNPVMAAQIRSFELEADAVMSRSRTQRAQTIVRAALGVVVLLVVWASFAHVEEVTRGDGKVIPSRQLQVVQSLDGGVVSEILVREGQVVEEGQLLLKIDETRATSGVRESAAQGFALRARSARLRALAEGKPFIPPKMSDANDAEENRILEEERRLYESKLSELNTMVAINRQQLQQRQQELSEMRARRDSAERTLSMNKQELTKTRPLLATGAVSEVDILRLDREVSRSRGDVEQSGAQISRVQASIGEAQRKVQETELAFRNEARRDMADVMGKLNALNEGAVALLDKVDKTQVKSPVRGRVQRLLANTVGGVRQPGQGHRRDRAAGRPAGARGQGHAQGHRLHPPGPERHGEVHRLRLLDLRRPGSGGREHQPRHRGRRTGQCLLPGAGAHHQAQLQREDAHHPGHDRRGGHPHRQQDGDVLPAQAGAQGQGLRAERTLRTGDLCPCAHQGPSRGPFSCQARTEAQDL